MRQKRKDRLSVLQSEADFRHASGLHLGHHLALVNSDRSQTDAQPTGYLFFALACQHGFPPLPLAWAEPPPAVAGLEDGYRDKSLV